MPELQTLRGWQDQIAGWRDLVTYSGSVDMQGMMRVMAQLKQSEIGTATGTINGLPPCTEALNELHSVMTNDGAAPGCSLLLNAMGMYALLPVLFMTRSNRNSPEPVCFESFFDIDWSTAQVHVGIISSPNPHHPPGPPPDPPSPLPTPPSQPPPSPTPSPTPPPPLLDYSLKQAREIGIATGLFLLAGAIAAAAGLAVRARRRRSTTPSSYTFLSPSAAIEEHGLWWVPSRETLDEWLPRLSQGTSDSIYSFDMRSLPPPRDGSSSGDSGSATDGYSLSKASSSSGDSSSKPLAEGEGSVGSDGSRSRDGDMRLRVVTSKSRPWMVGRGGEGDVYLALVERGARNLFTGYVCLVISNLSSGGHSSAIGCLPRLAAVLTRASLAQSNYSCLCVPHTGTKARSRWPPSSSGARRGTTQSGLSAAKTHSTPTFAAATSAATASRLSESACWAAWTRSCPLTFRTATS